MIPSFGQNFDEGHEKRGSRVLLVGAELASRLGINSWSRPVQVSLNGHMFTVIGVVTSADPASGLDSTAIVPLNALRDLGMPLEAGELAIEVTPGAASSVAAEVSAAVDPTGRSSVAAQAPPDPQGLRQTVAADTQIMVAIFALVALIIGAAASVYPAIKAARVDPVDALMT